MIIAESLGIVTDEDKMWEELSNMIVDYVFDVKDGLNADPFYDGENATITMNNIISYCKFKMPLNAVKKLIPFWIGDFTILLGLHIINKGCYVKSKAYLKDEKLYFTIKVRDERLTPDWLMDVMIHEFRHAYTHYNELINHFAVHNKQTTKSYMDASKAFLEDKYIITKFVKEKGLDYIILNPEIFEDTTTIESIILRSFYYADIDEISSYLLEFAGEIKREMIRNKESILNIADEVNKKKKFDFNNSNYNNLQDKVNITCLSSKVYTTYKAFHEFWKNVSKIDEDIAWDVVNNIKKPIKNYLGISISKKILNFSGDGTQLLKALAKRQIPIFENVLRKMQKIYADILTNISNEKRTLQIVKKEINDPEFEKMLMDLVK